MTHATLERMVPPVRWTWLLALVAVVLGGPSALVGQRSMPQRPSGPPPRGFGFMPGEHHGRLGVLVNTEADPQTDSLGAHIEAVTPGGPAAKAGLKAGDVITRFHGTALAGVRSDEDGGSGPGRKLVELARALSPGDTVQVEYRRGTDRRKTNLVAGDVSVISGMDHFEMPRLSVLPGAPDEGFSFCFGESWCDMELVALNPDLGDYFGTKEGILVVKTPADSSLPLKSGDVILSIGGRKPTSASHAMRILRSYDANESVTLDIMRKQRRTSVTWQVPQSDERARRFMRFHRMPLHPDSGDDAPQS